MTVPVLREYQNSLVDGVRAAFKQGARRVLIVAPTGAGKGTIAAYFVARAVEKGNSIVFLVNRRTLVFDMSKRLRELGIIHGILMGQNTRGQHLPVQVASIDTLRRRDLPKAALVFVDEAHFALSEGWIDVIDRYVQAGSRIIEMTATPHLMNGRGLKRIADVMVIGPSVRDLTAQGFLVPIRTFTPKLSDFVLKRKTSGDYTDKQLEKYAENPKRIADIVDTWGRLGRGMPSIGFFVNRRDSENICSKFRGSGVEAVHVDANTPDGERERIWVGLADRTIPYVCSVGIIGYGWDVPPVAYESQGRPTESEVIYRQQGGRIMRPFPGKEYGILADHAGNFHRHGYLDDDRDWSLADRERKKIKAADEILPPNLLPKACPDCDLQARPTALRCENCGYVFTVAKFAEIVEGDGELNEQTEQYEAADYTRYAADADNDPALKAIIQTAQKYNHKPGSVWYKRKALNEARDEYRDKFSREPMLSWSSAAINSMIEAAA